MTQIFAVEGLNDVAITGSALRNAHLYCKEDYSSACTMSGSFTGCSSFSNDKTCENYLIQPMSTTTTTTTTTTTADPTTLDPTTAAPTTPSPTTTEPTTAEPTQRLTLLSPTYTSTIKSPTLRPTARPTLRPITPYYDEEKDPSSTTTSTTTTTTISPIPTTTTLNDNTYSSLLTLRPTSAIPTDRPSLVNSYLYNVDNYD